MKLYLVIPGIYIKNGTSRQITIKNAKMIFTNLYSFFISKYILMPLDKLMLPPILRTRFAIYSIIKSPTSRAFIFFIVNAYNNTTVWCIAK